MSASYALRLVFVSMAAFFLVHTLVGCAISWIAPLLIRWLAVMRPRRAARLLLYVRLFPPGFSLFLVVGFFVPSFLWGEPDQGTERIGLICLTLAAMAVAIWTAALWRTARALRGAAHYR